MTLLVIIITAILGALWLPANQRRMMAISPSRIHSRFAWRRRSFSVSQAKQRRASGRARSRRGSICSSHSRQRLPPGKSTTFMAEILAR